MTVIPTISASDDAQKLADWTELAALHSRRPLSVNDIIREIRRGGTTDALAGEEDLDDDVDEGSDDSERIAESAFEVIERREQACGGAYPFELSPDGGSVEPTENSRSAPYSFLLLLSVFGLQSGPPGSFPERTFEDLCAVAAATYLGGPHGPAEGLAFGFPRHYEAKGFGAALIDLYRRLGVGELKPGLEVEELSKSEKDSGIDVIAWRHFPDREPGQLIAFGQCAVGRTDWKEKASALNPGAFCRKWLKVEPPSDPVPMYFIPFDPTRGEKWRHLTADVGGVVFDRQRIAYLLQDYKADARHAASEWSKHVLSKMS